MKEQVKIVIGGDICTAGVKDKADAAYAATALREVKPIFDAADIRIANLECVLCEDGVGAPIIKSGPNLYAYPKNVAILTELDLDAVTLANNHFGDYGATAIDSTLSVLNKADIAFFGGGANKAQAYRAYRAEQKGIRLSFLSVCENEFGVATESTPGAAGFDLKYLRDRMAEEKTLCDFLIVIFHGGNEQNPLPSPAVIDRYRLLIDLGADAVIAAHTHCIQGVETYCGKPIIYSMGNFYFPARNGPKDDYDPWYYGYLTELCVQMGKPITFVLHPYALRGNGDLLHLLEGAEKEIIDAYIQRLSDIIQDPAQVQRYYDAWATHLGAYYISHFDYKKEYQTSDITDEQLLEFSPIKNLFGCEAHNDLIRTLTRLIYEKRFDQAHAALGELLELQKIPQIK